MATESKNKNQPVKPDIAEAEAKLVNEMALAIAAVARQLYAQEQQSRAQK